MNNGKPHIIIGAIILWQNSILIWSTGYSLRPSDKPKCVHRWNQDDKGIGCGCTSTLQKERSAPRLYLWLSYRGGAQRAHPSSIMKGKAGHATETCHPQEDWHNLKTASQSSSAFSSPPFLWKERADFGTSLIWPEARGCQCLIPWPWVMWPHWALLSSTEKGQ